VTKPVDAAGMQNLIDRIDSFWLRVAKLPSRAA
jgi:hypothetical protein